MSDNHQENTLKKLEALRVETLKQLNQELLVKHNLEDPHFLNNAETGMSIYYIFRSAPGVSIPIEFVDERTNYGWRDELNGKSRVYVGDYGDKQCFRTKKGVFDVPAIAHHIAQKLKHTAERVNLQRFQDEEKRAYDEQLTELQSQYGLSKYTRTIDSRASGLVVTLTELSREQADQLLALASKLNIKL